MDYVERYVIELDDGTFALWGQFVEGETHSILGVDEFCNGTFLRKDVAKRKVEQINNGVWKFQSDTKKAIGIRKVEIRMVAEETMHE